MFKYLLLLPIHILGVLLRYPLAPLAVLLQKDYRLRFPFIWLDTIDNSLLGDDGWREEHLVGDDPASYTNMVRWVWRNGANNLNYHQLGQPEGTSPFWSVCSDPGWQWRLGWNPNDSKSGRTKYNFTIRWRRQ